jgi:hypothetical protein
LEQRHGKKVISSSGVEAVLRRAKLWDQPTKQGPINAPRPPDKPDWWQRGIDVDRLLATIQDGIRFSLQSEVDAAIGVLDHQVWRPLATNRTLWLRALASRENGLGSWLLCSRLHLGHSLMNVGRWEEAERCLLTTIDWMREYPLDPRQRAWEEHPRFVSLRRDDIWLGCHEHLALVLGKTERTRAVGYLTTARDAVRRSHRPVTPSDDAMRGDLERNLAYIKLRSRYLHEPEICAHLACAQEAAEASGSPGKLAFTYIAWARLHNRLAHQAGDRQRQTFRRQRDLMIQALEHATELAERDPEDRPMRYTICSVDAAELAARHGLPLDYSQLQRAAENCLLYGYGGQAAELLAVPAIQAGLPEALLGQLSALVFPAHTS